MDDSDVLKSKLVKELLTELNKAEAKFPPFNSAHEGWAVLYEEVDELWDAVRMQNGKERNKNLRAEAVQVGAMALRFLLFLEKYNRE